MAKKSKLLEELRQSMKDIKLESKLEALDIDVLKDITMHIKGVKDYRTDISYQFLENVCVNFIIDKINKLTDLFISNDNNEVVSKVIIAYDGKARCGSKRNNIINGEVFHANAMTAFNATKDISLTTNFISEKTNEILIGPELIKLLDLTNTISIFDVLNTQRETIKVIVDKDGDYVGALKGNQYNFIRMLSFILMTKNCMMKYINNVIMKKVSMPILQ